VRFWDASALLPVVVQETGSALSRKWLDEDAEVCTWGLTAVEIASAIERRAREGRLSSAQRIAMLRRAEELLGSCHEVTDLLAVRRRAVPLLARHALGAADAAQLASALLVADPDPASLTFVCLDRRLADAASREGLSVLGWPD
jgi:predicted nucleic acid-binding protein